MENNYMTALARKSQQEIFHQRYMETQETFCRILVLENCLEGEKAFDIENVIRDEKDLDDERRNARRCARRMLKRTKRKFHAQLCEQAKRECRPLCERMVKKLPQELRDIVYGYLITDCNATFVWFGKTAPSLVNGENPFYHCFDPDYTGVAMHRDLIKQLGSMGARFDIQRRYKLLNTVFDYYRNEIGLDLTSCVQSWGVEITAYVVENSDIMLGHLKHFLQLARGTALYIFIRTGKVAHKVLARAIRKILCVIFPPLTQLHDNGIKIHLVINAGRRMSSFKDDHCHIVSLICAFQFPPTITPENTTFTEKGIREKILELHERQDYMYLYK